MLLVVKPAVNCVRKPEPRTLTFLTPTGVGNHERARGVGQTTDQLRTTAAELSAPQRSTMDTSDKSFTLDDRGGPIWGSRGREFKSRQPDGAKCLVRRQIYLSKYLCFMIVFALDHLF